MADDLRIDIKTTTDTREAEAQIVGLIKKYDKSTIQIDVKTDEGKNDTKKRTKEQEYLEELLSNAARSQHELNAQELAYASVIQKSTKALNALNKARAQYNTLTENEGMGGKELIKNVKLYNDAAAYALKAIGDAKATEDIINRGTARQSASSVEERYLNNQLTQASNNRYKLIELEEKYQDKIKESAFVLQELGRVKAGYDALSDTSGSMEDQIRDVQKYNNEIKELIKVLKGFEDVDPNKTLKAQASFQSFLDQNSKYRTDSSLVKEADDIMKLYAVGTTGAFDTATKKASAFKATLELLGKTGASTFDKMAEKLNKFTSWFTVSQAVMMSVNLFKNMVNNVRELDASLIELVKVSDLSGSSLEKFTNDAFDLGQTLARTGKEVIDATTTFKRAGYDLNESFQLAEQALLLTNVGDGIKSVEAASSSLIAILRGYEFDDSYANNIVDMINAVSNTAPIDASNITDGLTRTAALLAQSGTSIEETIGLITGGFAQLRNVEWVSTGLNMISQRLRGIEEDGTKVAGLASRIEGEFRRLAGINILEGGELRSTYDIIADMAEIFPKMIADGKSVQVQYLTELAAGNRQARNLTAIVNGWEDVEKAVSSAMNSEGSAFEENQKYMDSIQGKLSNMQSAFQSLSKSFISSNMFKGAVDAATEFLKVITMIVDAVGALPVAAAAITGGATLFGKRSGLFKDMDFLLGGQFSVGDGLYNAFSKNGDSIEKAASAVDLFNLSLQRGKPFQEAATIAAQKGSAAFDAYVQSIPVERQAAFKASMDGVYASLNLTTGALLKAKAAALAWNIALNAGIALAFSVAATLISKLVKAQQDTIDKAYELRAAFKESMDSINSNISNVKNLEDEFKQLSLGVGQYGENISLSAEEYRRYQEIVNGIVEISPSLVTGYTNEGNAIINKNTAIEETIRLLNEQKQLEMSAYYSQDTMWKNLKGSLVEYDRQLTEYNRSAYFAIELLKDRDYSNDKKNFIADVLGLDPQGDYTEFFTKNTNIILSNIDKLIKEANNKSSKYYGILSDKDIEKLSENTAVYKRELAHLSSLAESFDAEMVGLTQMAEGYDKLDAMNKNLAARFASSFSLPDFRNDYEFSGLEKFTEAYNDILSFTTMLSKNTDLQDAVTNFFSLDKSKISINEWQKQAKELYDQIIGSLEKTPTEELQLQLRVALGLSIRSNEDPTKEIDNISELYKNVRDKLGVDNLSDEFLGKFTQTELDIIVTPNFEVKNIDKSLGNIEQSIRDELDRLGDIEVTTNVGYIYDTLLDKLNLLNDAVAEQAALGYISEDTYRNIYNQGSDYIALLENTSGTFRIITSDAEDYRDVLIDMAMDDAVMAGANDQLLESFRRLYKDVDQASNSFLHFQEIAEMTSKSIDMFEVAESAIKTLQDGLKNGRTETAEFHAALAALYGDNLPDNLTQSLKDLSVIFSTEEDSIDDMIKKIKKLTGTSELSLKKIQDALGITDDAMAILTNRLDEAGLLYASGTPSIYKLGNGLGLLAEKSQELEGKAAKVFSEFEDGQISIEEAREKFGALLREFGVTGDAADTALANWERLLRGLNVDTIGAFKGLDAPVQKQVSEMTQSYIDQFNAEYEEKSKNNKLHELPLDMNVQAYKDELAKLLMETGEYSEQKVKEMVDALGEEYYEVQIQTFLTNSLQRILMTEDLREEVVNTIRQAIGEDGQVDYNVLVDLFISTSKVKIDPDTAVEVRKAAEKYLNGEITLSELSVELSKLNLGGLEKTLPIALQAAQELNSALSGSDDETKNRKKEMQKLADATKNAYEQTKKLSGVSLASLMASAGLAAVSIGLIERAAVSAKKALDVLNGTRTPTSNPSSYGGGRATMAEGGVSFGKTEAIVGDEFPGAYEMVLSADGSKKVYGKNGAELITLNDGDIVFPHDITKKIMSGQIPLLADGNWPSGGSNYSSTSGSSSKSKNSKSTKETSDAVKEQIAALFDELRHQLEMDMITEAQYYKKLEEYNNKYYKGKSDLLKEYRSNLEAIYKWRKEQEEKAVELQFDTLKHQLEMDKITEKEYYKELDKLNDKHYKGKEDKLSEYRSNLEEIYKWQVQQEEDMIKLQFDTLQYELNMNKITEADYYNELSRLNDKYYKGKEDKLNEYRSNLESLYNYQKQEEANAIQHQFDDLNHQLNMEYISQVQYYKKLAELNEKYYKANMDKVSEYRSNLETLYKWEREQVRNSLNAQISLLELLRSMANQGSPNYNEYTERLYALQKQMQNQIQKELSHYRMLGYQEDSDILQRLKQEWYDIEKWKREEIRKTKELEIENQESAVNAVVRRLNKQIEDLKKKRDDLSNEDIVGSYGYRIKAIRDEIDSLKKRNDEVNKELELQKERDNLERLRNQRNLLIYREGIGFVYELDTSAIEEAEKKVKDLELDIYINKLEKEQKELEDQLKAEQKAIDESIAGWEEYRDLWQNLTDEYRESQEELMAIQEIGADWEALILDKRLDTFEKFRQSYLEKLKSLNEEIANNPIPDPNADLGKLKPQTSNELPELNEIITVPLENTTVTIPTNNSGYTSVHANDPLTHSPNGASSALNKIRSSINGTVLRSTNNNDIILEVKPAVYDGQALSDIVQVENMGIEFMSDISSRVQEISGIQKSLANDLNRSLLENISQIDSNNLEISMGDIIIQETNNSNDLARQIVSSLPNQVAQAIYKKTV